jgi:LCP family protein required for cell wall assembly
LFWENNKKRNPVDKIVKQKNKPLKIILSVIGLAIFGIVSWVGIGAFAAISKISTSQTSSAPFLGILNQGEVNASELKGEGDGRINILLLGLGGVNHPGGTLSDTIMVASIDPQNKKIAFLSIPRDLYVPIEGYGSTKINYAHAYGEMYPQETGGGPAVAKETVSKILDLPIHYYVRADFDGFTQLVDELGGLTVDVQNAISDPYYPADNMVDYDPFYLNAGTQILDGETALKFARSRETTSDFDRASRQQQLLVAIKQKALSLNILTNPKKLVDILQIMGDHVSTDLQTWEIEKLVTLLKDVDTSNIVMKVLDNSSEGSLVSEDIDGGYYLVPKAGVGNFTQIQRIAHEIFSDPYLGKENAQLEILNATGQAGAAKEVQDTLASYGYNVVQIDTNPTVSSKTVIYDYSNGKNPYTVEYLKKRYNAEVITQSSKSSTIDLSLVLGQDYLKNNVQNQLE